MFLEVTKTPCYPYFTPLIIATEITINFNLVIRELKLYKLNTKINILSSSYVKKTIRKKLFNYIMRTYLTFLNKNEWL